MIADERESLLDEFRVEPFDVPVSFRLRNRPPKLGAVDATFPWIILSSNRVFRSNPVNAYSPDDRKHHNAIVGHKFAQQAPPAFGIERANGFIVPDLARTKRRNALFAHFNFADGVFGYQVAPAPRPRMANSEKSTSSFSFFRRALARKNTVTISASPGWP